MKKKTKVKSFRVNKKTELLLNRCFTILNIKDDNFNAKMSNFIIQAHDQLNTRAKQKKEILRLELERKKLESDITKKKSKSLVTSLQKPKLQPPKKKETKPTPEEPKRDLEAKHEEPKTEPLRHTKPMQKPSISTKPTESDLVWCPDKDDWVQKSIECKKCGSTNFKKFSDCYAARNRIRIGKATKQDIALFIPTKPKPNL